MPPQSILPATMGPLESLIADGKVYIRNHDGDEELYDLLGDPLERDNLIDQPSPCPTAARFRELLDQILADSGSRGVDHRFEGEPRSEEQD
jgi:hypothetical protein